MDNGDASFFVSRDACVDAKAVLSALEPEETKIPAESTLPSSLQAVKEDLGHERLARVVCVDTRDLLADGLTKGSIDRTAIRNEHSKCSG